MIIERFLIAELERAYAFTYKLNMDNFENN